MLSGLSARRTRPVPISCATCCLVPACRTGFFDDGSEEGRRLLREHDVEGSGVPVAIHYDGTVLVDPAHAELMGKRACVRA